MLRRIIGSHWKSSSHGIHIFNFEGNKICIRCLSQTNNLNSKIVRQTLKDDSNNWDALWQRNVTPWDLGKPTPALQHELGQFNDDLKRVLVPGCGAGYDLVTIAKHCELYGGKSDIIGIDLSETCIRKAKNILHEASVDEKVTLVTGNFFSDFYGSEERFDFVFDYTFFCALPPRMRVDWGKRMGELIKEGGQLLTLVFPIPLDGEESSNPNAEGPPYPVSVDEYRKVLEPQGFSIEFEHRSASSIPQRADHEKVVWWTHK